MRSKTLIVCFLCVAALLISALWHRSAAWQLVTEPAGHRDPYANLTGAAANRTALSPQQPSGSGVHRSRSPRLGSASMASSNDARCHSHGDLKQQPAAAAQAGAAGEPQRPTAAAAESATISKAAAAEAAGMTLDHVLLEGRFSRQPGAVQFEWPLSTIR